MLSSLCSWTADAVQGLPATWTACPLLACHTCRHRVSCLTVQRKTSQLGVQVTGAEAALRKMLPLVFSKEQGDCLLLHACWACCARN